MPKTQIKVSIVSDGAYVLDGGLAFGPVPRVIWGREVKTDRLNRVRLGLNCLLIEHPAGNILVDAGLGNFDRTVTRELYGHTTSKLIGNLRHAGIAARKIAFVVLTRWELPHIGGLVHLDRDGDPNRTFANARIIVQRDVVCPAWPCVADNLIKPPEMGLSRIQAQVEYVTGAQEIVPGVRVEKIAGVSHTQQIVTVDTGSERYVFMGDVVPTPLHLRAAYLGQLDVAPLATVAAKAELLNRVKTDSWLMVFAHGLFTRAGYLRAQTRGQVFEPVAM